MVDRTLKTPARFKAWMLWDAEGTYVPTVHVSRNDAILEKKLHSNLRDAKWRIVPVTVMPR